MVILNLTGHTSNIYSLIINLKMIVFVVVLLLKFFFSIESLQQQISNNNTRLIE